jgi:MFS transporter, PAT family, beta-lactamase induction signal transducer AmpG
MLWGPLVDLRATKRAWILATQLAMAGCLGAVAAAATVPAWFAVTMLAFTAAAFVSATHDIAADGFYLLALDARTQALFVGIRAFFYRMAMLFGSGLLVFVAGWLETRTGAVPRAWSLTFALTAAVCAAAWLYHHFALPRPDADAPRGAAGGDFLPEFGRVMAAYFRRPGIAASVAFILLYRLGEALLVKLAAPFLLDARADGGLGLTTKQVGLVYGTVGVASLMAGGILGGWLLARYGLRRLIWPFALVLNLPHAAYLVMAHAQPAAALAYPLVAIEQLGYGLGFTAMTVYLLRLSRGDHGTAHYAISTGLMALGMMLPGFVSGAIEQAVGYRAFFWIVLAAGGPGLLVIPWLRLRDGPDAGSSPPAPQPSSSR